LEEAAPEQLQTVFRVLDRPSGDGVIGVADLLAIVGFVGSPAAASL